MRRLDAGGPKVGRWRLGRAALVVLLPALLFGRALSAAPGTQGQWSTLSYQMPINPIHLALMNNGKVLVVAGSGNDATNKDYKAAVWDPQTGAIISQPMGYDMFCNGMVVLPDGRPFINSGTLYYDPFKGELRSSVYDPATGSFALVENMAHGRWYPTLTTLGDGRVMTFSGVTETGGTNTAVEIYTPGAGWSPEYQAGWTPPLYPRLHLLPDGRVFYSGSGRGSRFFSPATQAWSAVVASTNYSGTRTYGTSVLLPLKPADGYRPRVMIMGGGNPATATTELIDLSASTPSWQYGPSMSQPRIEMNATILPTGNVLALGGSKNDEDATTASLNADLYDPSSNTFSSAGSNKFPRLYHSNSLLLPDATVALVGGNPQRGSYEGHIEIYSPAYLFNADGTTAVRPTISGVTPGSLSYGGAFQIQTPDASDITSVVLVRPGTPTHSLDMDQRLVALSYSAGIGVLNITAPPNGNIAPPGYYMLFVLNSARVPSIARFVSLSSSSAPDFAIAAAPSSQAVGPGAGTSYTVTVTPGNGFVGNVSFSVSGLPARASASFTPPTVATSGSTTLGISTSATTPLGSYPLVITGTSGAISHAVGVTLVVTDFSISVSPPSKAIQRGNGESYTVTITGQAGFSSKVSLSVSGLPKFTTGTYTPSSVTGSGNSTLTVTTNKKVATGTFTLTVTGTSGTLVHSAPVTLIIQ